MHLPRLTLVSDREEESDGCSRAAAAVEEEASVHTR
jgi:hypothetical protein